MRAMNAERKTWSKEAVRLRTGRDADELVKELYVEKRYSQQEIATALGVSRSLIAKWLSDQGLGRDDRDPLVAA